jgi:S1-C subfamily serine protease
MGAKIFKPPLGSEEMDLGQRTETRAAVKWCSKSIVCAVGCVILLGSQMQPVLAQAVAERVRAADDVAYDQSQSDEPTAFEAIESAGRRSRLPSGEGTRVSVPIDLEPLHRRGGVPSSLELLRAMELQQRRVADRASKCTVSVKIGHAQGCGVIITGTGFIVTAAHVATRPGLKATITFSGGRQVSATTLGMNRHVDAGLIWINPGQNGGKPWPHASLGTSDDLVPGMWCIAMGHPGGYEPARGAVIRVGRLLEIRPDVVVSDCALIGGDSGGPLFNMAGELIAVHSRIGNQVTENLHVPIDHYDYSWKRMADGEAWGYLPNFKPTLGVSGNKSTADATIIDVKEGSPAEAGGMRPGDIVVRFGKKQVTDFASLIEAVADTMPGERVRIVVRRAELRVELLVEIGRSS